MTGFDQELKERQTARRVYLIRHGSTEMNSEDLIRGMCNVALSEEGREEVARLAALMRESNVRFLVSSDLDRAVETARAVAGQCGAIIAKTGLLRPWDVGRFTGRPAEEVTPRLFELACDAPNKATPGGESFNSFKLRAFEGLRTALSASDAPLGVVSHHRVERLLAAWLAAGCQRSLELDLDLMFTRGEPPAHAEMLEIPLERLADAPHSLAGESVIGPSSLDGSASLAGLKHYA
jgi:broad specificity phosphatase PhoE